jgi:hypothetical protein
MLDAPRGPAGAISYRKTLAGFPPAVIQPLVVMGGLGDPVGRRNPLRVLFLISDL